MNTQAIAAQTLLHIDKMIEWPTEPKGTNRGNTRLILEYIRDNNDKILGSEQIYYLGWAHAALVANGVMTAEQVHNLINHTNEEWEA